MNTILKYINTHTHMHPQTHTHKTHLHTSKHTHTHTSIHITKTGPVIKDCFLTPGGNGHRIKNKMKSCPEFRTNIKASIHAPPSPPQRRRSRPVRTKPQENDKSGSKTYPEEHSQNSQPIRITQGIVQAAIVEVVGHYVHLE